MFDKLRLVNFRSIAKSPSLKLAPLNVLVGPNNAGKSSVLYALLLLKYTMQDENPETALVTSLPGLDLGGYLDLVSGRDAAASIGMTLRLRDEAVQPPTKGREFSFCLKFHAHTNQIRVSDAFVADSVGKLLLRVTERKGGTVISGIPKRVRRHVGVTLQHFVPTSEPIGKGPRTEKTLSRAFLHLGRHRGHAQALQEALKRLLYISPLRARTPTFTVVGTQSPSEMSPTGADIIRLLASREAVQDTGKTLLELVAQTLRAQFGMLQNMSLRRVGKRFMELLADEPRAGVKGINVAYTGFGIGQLLPVVAQTWLLKRGGCLLVEQPEVHLHPRAQADLADLFLSRLRGGRQFIIETHSEHLVLRLRRRIAEGKCKPEHVRLFYFTKKGRLTTIEPLDIDADGMVPNWPAGFFEQGYEEALAIAEADMARKRR